MGTEATDRLTAAQLAHARGTDKPRRKPIPRASRAVDIPDSFLVILYDPKDPIFPPPHKSVDDLFGKRSVTWQKQAQDEEMHLRCLAGEFVGKSASKYLTCTGKGDCPVHRLEWCAACNWNARRVRNMRREKLQRLRLFQRTGKVTGWAGAGYPQGEVYKKHRRMTDAEAARIVLPTFPTPGYTNGKLTNPDALLREEDRVIHKVHERYLRAVGAKHVKTTEDNGVEQKHWSCGCITYGYRGPYGTPGCTPCAKHKGAFEGPDE
jgi:hypothetical protein